MMHTDFDETDYYAGYKSSYKPLTAEEEIDLSRLILAGKDAAAAFSGDEDLTEADCTDLLRAAEDGKKAYWHLVEANIPLGMKFARKVWERNQYGLNDLDDYKQLAMLFICEAALSFDWRQGCRFGTWAHRKLTQGMIRENAANAYAVRIPEDLLTKLSKLKQLVETMSLAEAAKALGMRLINARNLLLAAGCPVYLNEPVSGEDPDTEKGDLIPDPDAKNGKDIEPDIDLEADSPRLRAAMALLPADELELLELRMGFRGEIPTFEELTGGIYGKTAGGVQKRQAAAVRHLREIFNSLPLAG